MLNWWVWVDSNHRPHPYQGGELFALITIVSGFKEITQDFHPDFHPIFYL